MNIRHLALVTAATLLAACGGSDPELDQTGPHPTLPEQQSTLVPRMNIADPAGWGDRRPVVPAGYTITAIATDLQIPRQTLVLPNGDILVAEGRGGRAPKLRPKDVIAGKIKAMGNTQVESGNRLTLLRDADGDGTYELQTVFASGLDAPYGLAYIDGYIYVANQGELVRFAYRDGQTQAAGAPESVTMLPGEVNHHWTKAMTATADGAYLYVGIGSNSNAGERGLDVEQDRAQIWEIDPDTGAHRTYATGLRNPTALAVQPGTGTVWAVVNERDEIGPNLVPDYLTSVRDGAHYGWPWSYWGGHIDPRPRPRNPQKVAEAIAPDNALGSHVAALGVAFSSAVMGPPFADGVFVGEHGSWNRLDPAGYKVVFVPFSGGRPAGDPIDFVTGFREEDGHTFGRPVGVTVDPRGALIVADDLSNTIWRVVPDVRPVVPEAFVEELPVPRQAVDSAATGADEEVQEATAAEPDADE